MLATLALTAHADRPARAGVIDGEMFYQEGIALPPDAVVDVTLVDVTDAGQPGELVAAVQIRPQRQVPIHFEIHFADPEIDARRSYAIRASILADGRLLFVAAQLPRVLTQGYPSRVRVALTLVSSGRAGLRQIADRIWLAEDIGGRGVLDNLQSTISLTMAGQVSGSAGCNTMQATAQVDGRSLAFGTLATTRKICARAIMDQETRFLQALNRTREFRLDGPYLEFIDANGSELVRFMRLP